MDTSVYKAVAPLTCRGKIGLAGGKAKVSCGLDQGVDVGEGGLLSCSLVTSRVRRSWGGGGARIYHTN